jgi:hypothetical protein
MLGIMRREAAEEASLKVESPLYSHRNYAKEKCSRASRKVVILGFNQRHNRTHLNVTAENIQIRLEYQLYQHNSLTQNGSRSC